MRVLPLVLILCSMISMIEVSLEISFPSVHDHDPYRSLSRSEDMEPVHRIRRQFDTSSLRGTSSHPRSMIRRDSDLWPQNDWTFDSDLISLSDGNIDDWNNDPGLSPVNPDTIDDWNTDSGLSPLNLDTIDHWMVETHPQPLTVDDWTIEPDPNPLIADSIEDDWMIAVDPNWSFVDNQNSDENFLLAGNSDCDSSYADDIQLVGKVRRESSCRNPPVGQSDQPQQSPDESFDFRQFLYGNALEIFPVDLEVCPPSIFRTANTPVCKPRRYATTGVFGEAWVNLQGVKPRT